MNDKGYFFLGYSTCNRNELENQMDRVRQQMNEKLPGYVGFGRIGLKVQS